MGIVIPFPVRQRRGMRASACLPFVRIHVLPGDLEWHEWWTIAGSHGWLHGSWRDAVNDAVAYATAYGPAAIQIETGGHNA